MPCTPTRTPGGFTAIVCTPTRRCKCGNRAPMLCDWKVPTKKSGTCDRPLCGLCANEVGPDKHLCPAHMVAFKAWKAEKDADRD